MVIALETSRSDIYKYLSMYQHIYYVGNLRSSDQLV